MIIWHNGAFKPEQDASIAVTDRGFTLGDGVFDTMLAVDGVAQDLEAHCERLRRHAAMIGITLPDYKGNAIITALLQKNNFTRGRYAIRTTITRGPGARGLALPDDPRITIVIRAAPVPAIAEKLSLIIAPDIRRNEGSILSRIKSLNYGDNILALRAAQKRGADDAALLNNVGYLACASASNIYVRVGETILTPPLEDGAMDGIIRAQLIAQKFAQIGRIDAAMMAESQEIYLSNSITGLRKVTNFEGRAL